MNSRAALLSLLAALLVPAEATAAEFPVKPIRWIVPFAPGGGADALARTVQPAFAGACGQQLLIDNRAGASGTIGSEMMVKAPPDGYTLLLITTTHTINPSLIKLPFDPLKDFAPVSLILSQPNILVVHPSVTVKSVKELVALARAKPGSLSYAFGGSGSSPHLSGELFKLVAGIDLVHIPHRCSRPGCGSSRTARRQAQALPTGCAAAARGQSTLPGFMMPFGSSTCLSLRITSSSTALL